MFKKRISLIALVITGALTLFGLYVWNSFEGKVMFDRSYSSIDLPEGDSAFGGIFFIPHIPDSLPYSKYRMIEDSFNRIKQHIDLKNSGSGANMLSNSTFGFAEIKNRSFSEKSASFYNSDSDYVMKAFIDSINREYPNLSEKEAVDRNWKVEKKMNERQRYKFDSTQKELEKDQSYYFILNGYDLKDNDSKFFIKDNTYNLAYVKWDTVIWKGTDSFPQGHYESKRLKVRYASAYKRIFIPLTKNTYTALRITMLGFTLLSFIVIVYFFFGLPIQVLVNISRGKAFAERNISMLKQISWAAFILSVLMLTSPYIFRLIFWKIIPDDFILEPFLTMLVKNIPIFMIALVAFFVAKAFKRGYKLQQYEDLTI